MCPTSGGPAITDVIAGQVDFMFGTVAATYPHVSGGKLRALAVSAPERSKRLPDVPTVAQRLPSLATRPMSGTACSCPQAFPLPSPPSCSKPCKTC